MLIFYGCGKIAWDFKIERNSLIMLDCQIAWDCVGFSNYVILWTTWNVFIHNVVKGMMKTCHLIISDFFKQCGILKLRGIQYLPGGG